MMIHSYLDTNEHIKDALKINLKWVKSEKKWYFYYKEEGIWKEIDSDEASTHIRDFLQAPILEEQRKLRKIPEEERDERWKEHDKTLIEVLNKFTVQYCLKNILPYFKPEGLERWPDEYKDLVVVANGTLNLADATLHPYSHRFMMRKKLPWKFDPDFKITDVLSKAPNWCRYLHKVTNSPAVRRFISYLAGSFLSGRRFMKHLYYIWGPKDCGKSTYVDTIAYVLGSYANKLPKKSVINSDKDFTLAKLPGLRMGYIDEPLDKPLNEEFLKEVVGADTMDIEAKHVNSETIAITLKLILLSNKEPKASAFDKDFWPKLKVIYFENDLGYKSDPRPALRREGEHIFNWMVQCLQCMHNGRIRGLNPPEQIERWSEEMQNTNNPLKDFEEERLEFTGKNDDVIRKDVLRNEIRRYFEGDVPKFINNNYIKKYLKSYGCGEKHIKLKDGKRPRAWTGLRFKNDA